MDGLSGNVQFDVEGLRTNFMVDILELSLGGLMKIGEWNSTMRSFKFQRPQKPQKIKEHNVFNTTFTVLISIVRFSFFLFFQSNNSTVKLSFGRPLSFWERTT